MEPERSYQFLRHLAGRYIKRPLKRAYASRRDLLRKRTLFADMAHLVPPLELMHDGIADFRAYKENGEEFFNILVQKCGLSPSHHILDVGCGIGRKTLPLLKYLDPLAGHYDGVDIVQSGIDWCQTRITPRHPNFQFHLMDVYNGMYNPTAQTKASQYRFPFPDKSFDLVLLGSVFTHTLPNDTWNYLAEIERMLKPDGRCLITYFLLNAESEGLMAEGRSEHLFIHPLERCKVVDPENPEVAIAYREDDIAAAYQRLSLAIRDGIYYGSWCGRKTYLSFQDLIVATKPTA